MIIYACIITKSTTKDKGDEFDNVNSLYYCKGGTAEDKGVEFDNHSLYHCKGGTAEAS